jgi:hypothetical protein
VRYYIEHRKRRDGFIRWTRVAGPMDSATVAYNMIRTLAKRAGDTLDNFLISVEATP